MLNSASDYNYKISKMVVEIRDLNLGRRSVTNDIENIVTEISKKENLDPKNASSIF